MGSEGADEELLVPRPLGHYQFPPVLMGEVRRGRHLCAVGPHGVGQRAVRCGPCPAQALACVGLGQLEVADLHRPRPVECLGDTAGGVADEGPARDVDGDPEVLSIAVQGVDRVLRRGRGVQRQDVDALVVLLEGGEVQCCAGPVGAGAVGQGDEPVLGAQVQGDVGGGGSQGVSGWVRGWLRAARGRRGALRWRGRKCRPWGGAWAGPQHGGAVRRQDGHGRA